MQNLRFLFINFDSLKIIITLCIFILAIIIDVYWNTVNTTDMFNIS